MLAHSSSLGIAPTEWLTIAAKGNDDRPRLAPADSDARTRIIRLSGSDLAEFLAGQISREEALKRIEVRCSDVDSSARRPRIARAESRSASSEPDWSAMIR